MQWVFQYIIWYLTVDIYLFPAVQHCFHHLDYFQVLTTATLVGDSLKATGGATCENLPVSVKINYINKESSNI